MMTYYELAQAEAESETAVRFKRMILNSVGHTRLKQLSTLLDAKPEDLRSCASIRQAIIGMNGLTDQELLSLLKVEELKRLCGLCHVPGNGKKADLIRTLIVKNIGTTNKTSPPSTDNKHRVINTDRFAAIDFETADHQRDSACAVGLVTVDNGEIVDRSCFLIKPPRRNFAYTDVHGISWVDVAYAETFRELWPKLLPKIENSTFLVAHNASFDCLVLEACCRTYGLVPPALPFECTMKLSRQVWKLKQVNLPSVCRFLGIELRKHHDPIQDAEACARIMVKIREEIKGNQ